MFRGQAPDELAPRPAPRPPESRPAPVNIPTPEQLGIAAAPAASGAADWVAVRRRLQELRAVCFQLENRPQGGCRFVCLLPTGQPGRNQRIEAEADTEAEAVRLALERAEQWATARR